MRPMSPIRRATIWREEKESARTAVAQTMETQYHAPRDPFVQLPHASGEWRLLPLSSVHKFKRKSLQQENASVQLGD